MRRSSDCAKGISMEMEKPPTMRYRRFSSKSGSTWMASEMNLRQVPGFTLLLRLIVEYRSYISFRRIDIRSDFTNYTKGITKFYRSRKKIHYAVTPVVSGAYITGFMLLLPIFKKSFSTGFFWYIVISGCSLLILFTVLLTRQIKKETRLLDFLNEIA